MMNSQKNDKKYFLKKSTHFFNIEKSFYFSVLFEKQKKWIADFLLYFFEFDFPVKLKSPREKKNSDNHSQKINKNSEKN